MSQARAYVNRVWRGGCPIGAFTHQHRVLVVSQIQATSTPHWQLWAAYLTVVATIAVAIMVLLNVTHKREYGYGEKANACLLIRVDHVLKSHASGRVAGAILRLLAGALWRITRSRIQL